MGIGYWTSEDLRYDPDTGALTNYRTWVNQFYKIYTEIVFSTFIQSSTELIKILKIFRQSQSLILIFNFRITKYREQGIYL